MKISYSAIWQDVMGLLRTHGTLIAAIAGVFIFLPALLTGYLILQPETQEVARMGQVMGEYFAANWHWLLLQGLLAMIGTIAILLLIFARAGTSVGAAIAGALPFLLSYFAASILSGIIIVLGLILLIVPGLYLFGRLAPLGAVLVAERRMNPVAAIGRTFELTKGNGWAILGLVLIIGIAALVVAVVVNSVLGLIFMIAAGEEIGQLLVLIVSTATSAAVTLLFVLLYAALYRSLTGGQSAAAAAAD